MTNALTHHGVTVWSVPAITDAPPTAATLPGTSLDLYAMAARGQWVPLSFCLRSTNRCTIRLSAPTRGGPTVDLRWVKSWWQSPVPRGGKVPVMTPELLLHDPTLIMALPDKTNAVRSPLLDAERIEPIELAQNVTQQVWVLVHTSSFRRSSRYRVTITVEVGNAGHWDTFEVPVLIDVLPFELPPSPMSFAAYYRAALYSAGPLKVCTPLARYRDDLLCMRDHGINRVLCFDDLFVLFDSDAGIAKVAELLTVWRECGMSVDPFYSVVCGLPWYTPETMDELRTKTQKMRAFCDAQGIKDFYLYARDDATPTTLAAGLPYWRVVHECGGEVFAACGPTPWAEILPIVGGNLDLILHNDATADPKPWKAAGSQAWLYGPSSPETPVEWYRRRYGVEAQHRGWDGGCLYAYQHIFGSPWNDVDDPYKDHMLTYPADSGPIDTIQFWGLTVGIDDVLYATLAESLGIVVPDHSGSLDAWRAEVTRLILEKG